MDEKKLTWFYVLLVLFNFYTAYFFAALMYCLIGKPWLDLGNRLLDRLGLGRTESVNYVERSGSEVEGDDEDDRESLLLNDGDDDNRL